MRRAVIDVGSNSVLLTVAEFADGTWTPILETTEVTALGEGVKVTGVLGEAGMSETLGAVKRAYEQATMLGAAVTAAVTMAARIAKNTDTFLERARGQATPIEVLSGEDEAQLGFMAVANDPAFLRFQTISIVDVGGHSTEVVTALRFGDGWDVKLRKSFSVGTLGLMSGLLSDEKPSGIARFRAAAEIDNVFGLDYGPSQSGAVIALGATGTNLVSIRDRMAVWNPVAVHGAYLDYEEISRAVAWLSSLSLAERSGVVGMEPGRERTLPGGALILERALYGLKSEGCYVSVRGWRHALIERG